MNMGLSIIFLYGFHSFPTVITTHKEIYKFWPRPFVSQALLQLETAKRAVETLGSDNTKAKEAYNAIASELDQSKARVNLKENEMYMQIIIEENELLKLGSKEMEFNLGNVSDEAVTELDAARAAEHDTLMKLGYATGEAEKSHRKAAQMTEQLEAARFANSELEPELRRVKMQSEVRTVEESSRGSCIYV